MSRLYVYLAPLVGAMLLSACATPKGLAPEYALTDADTLAITRSLGADGHGQFPHEAWWRGLAMPNWMR